MFSDFAGSTENCFFVDDFHHGGYFDNTGTYVGGDVAEWKCVSEM
jgi:hypothetical protein